MLRVLDVGCGKGRYLARLAREPFAERLQLHGCDLSDAVLSYAPKEITAKQGSCLNLPYADSAFDFVFSCEALEHCVHTQNALKELWRVVQHNGMLLVIDKNIDLLGALQLQDTEQWFATDAVRELLIGMGGEVSVHEGVPHDGHKDKLFTAWFAKKGCFSNDIKILTSAEWHKAIVGGTDPATLANRMGTGHVPEWLSAILEATEPGDVCLELGSGTGLLSAALASQQREAALLDFSETSLDFSKKLFQELHLSANMFVRADVLKKFPFDDGVFDCVWSSGLLEHFSDEEIAFIISESARIARKKVVSLVPNAASIAYRIGKWHQESTGEWRYGYEDPKYTLAPFYTRVDMKNVFEYSIGWHHALKFMTFQGADVIKNIGSCLVESFMIGFKARYANEKQVCNSFKNF